MLLDWSDYSADSGTEDVPLLLSTKSQSLILAAMQVLESRSNWLGADDNDAMWDDIDAAVSEAYEEIIEVVMTDATPVGAIVAFIGLIADIPDKWLPCNNTTYAQVDYPELASILKPTFISGSNFNTPNLQGHYIRGAVSDSDHSGESGSNSHTLTASELPAHHHVVPAHSHTLASRVSGSLGGSQVAAMNSLAANSTLTTDTEPATDTSDTGDGTAFSVEPLHYRFHWIIKALP